MSFLSPVPCEQKGLVISISFKDETLRLGVAIKDPKVVKILLTSQGYFSVYQRKQRRVKTAGFKERFHPWNMFRNNVFQEELEEVLWLSPLKARNDDDFFGHTLSVRN